MQELLLNKKAKLGIIIIGVIVSLSIIGRISRTINIVLVSGLGLIVIVGAYMIGTKILSSDESFDDYTTLSPLDSEDNSAKCYSNGQEVDCNLLNNTDSEDVQYNANNLSTQYHNSVNNQQPQQSENINGSFGIDKDEVYKQIESNQDSNNNLPNECYPKDILSPSELLPKDTNSVWAQSVPSGQGSLGDQNFLNAGFHVGMNTVGQTLRNPNYQLRSEPANPQVKVSPWMQSTIEPDSNRKAMEIGG